MKYKSRKLIVAGAIFALAFAYISFTKTDLPPNFVDLTKWLFAVYAAGNVGSKFANK
jgi:hypothetical protein